MIGGTVAQGTREHLGKRRLLFTALCTCAIFAIALLFLPAALAETDSMGFDARPLPGSPNAELGFFKFEAKGGESVQRVLVITNHTDKAKVISVAPVDAQAAVFGGVAYSESGKPPKAVGIWIDLSSQKVDVPANSSVQVPFDVVVPGDVASGDHLGGIALWEPAAATSNTSGDSGSDKATTKITMVTRVVLTVYVITPGPSVPNLTIAGVKTEARPDGMYLIVNIANDGTGPTRGEGTVTLPSDGFQQKIELGDMIPASSTGYPVKWKTDPAAGDYDGQVEIRYEDGAKVATWSGKVTVAAAEVAALEDRLVAPETPSGTSGGGTPWLAYGLVGGLILVVLVMGFALLRRRRPGPTAGAAK
jgi:hypothetical protein